MKTAIKIKNHINHFLKWSHVPVLAALLAIATLGSCGDFLEEYSQDHDYVRSWEDLNELLLGDCYMPVNTSSYFKDNSNVGTFVHLLSDEADAFNEAGSTYMGYGVIHYEFGYLTWQLRVGAKEDFTTFYSENTTWTQMYKYINVANNVIESATGVPQSTDDEKAGVNYVLGQAHFLRAWYYFWLANMYGQPYQASTAATDLAVPLKTTKEVEDIKFSRNTVQECYDLIVSDLLAAEKELAAAGSITRKSIYRADSVSAQLLLSRVYLYMQDWDKAAEYAQKVIGKHGTLANLNSYDGFFASVSNPETIFSMGGDDLPTTLNNGYQSVTLTKKTLQQLCEQRPAPATVVLDQRQLRGRDQGRLHALLLHLLHQEQPRVVSQVYRVARLPARNIVALLAPLGRGLPQPCRGPGLYGQRG